MLTRETLKTLTPIQFKTNCSQQPLQWWRCVQHCSRQVWTCLDTAHTHRVSTDSFILLLPPSLLSPSLFVTKTQVFTKYLSWILNIIFGTYMANSICKNCFSPPFSPNNERKMERLLISLCVSFKTEILKTAFSYNFCIYLKTCIVCSFQLGSGLEG